MNPGEATMDPAKVVTSGQQPTPTPDKGLPSIGDSGPKQAFMTNSAFFPSGQRAGVQAELEQPSDFAGT